MVKIEPAVPRILSEAARRRGVGSGKAREVLFPVGQLPGGMPFLLFVHPFIRENKWKNQGSPD
jgi:hypothetical protein